MKKTIAERYKFYTCTVCKQRMKSILIKPRSRICYECYERYDNPFDEEEYKMFRKFIKSLQEISS